MRTLCYSVTPCRCQSAACLLTGLHLRPPYLCRFRLLTDGFSANSTATVLVSQPNDSPLIQLQDQLNATYRWG